MSETEIWLPLKEYHGKFFDGEWPTIMEMFNISLAQFPDRTCFFVFDPDKISYTYTQVYQEIRRVASVMIEAGVKKGDKVVINGKNSIQWAISYFAVNYAGATVVPMDNQMHTDRFLRLSAFADSVYMIADADVIDKIPEDNEWHKTLYGELTMKGEIEGLDSVMTAKPSKLYDMVKISDNDVAAILFTSGTTGNEKGAMLTNANITSDVYLVRENLDVTENDVFYALLPLHHSYTCTTVLLESVKHGGACLFGHGIVVSRMINDLKRGEVTVFMGIPLVYNKVLSGIMKQIKGKGKFTYGLVRTLMAINGFFKSHFHWSPFKSFFNKRILSQLGLDHNNILICGAGPLSPKVFKQYQQFGLDFLQGYGLTEAAPVVTLNPKAHFKVDSIGKALPWLDVIIADKNEEGIGEIRVKGPNVMLGYYKDKESTDEIFDENGYLRTGDLGTMDSEGYIVLHGRAKNLIVTEGGKNVYPEEIEDMFQTFENIEQIMVRGFQQKKDVPCECIEAVIFPSPEYYKGKSKDEIKADVEATVKKVNTELLGYKKIEKITILEERMEETTTRKIKRRTVAQ